jgi:hypothetical protein
VVVRLGCGQPILDPLKFLVHEECARRVADPAFDFAALERARDEWRELRARIEHEPPA